MKLSTLCPFFLLVASFSVAAQEVPERVLRAAELLHRETAGLKDLPLTLKPNIQKPVFVGERDGGVLVIPAEDLKESSVGGAPEKPLPVAQVWLLGVVPQKAGKNIPEEQLRKVKIQTDEGEFELVLLQAAIKGDQLLLYSQDKEPFMTVSLASTSGFQDFPIELEAERKDETSGVLKLNFFGSYQASVPLGKR